MSFQVGDRVKIVNQGKLYSSYGEWMVQNGQSMLHWKRDRYNLCSYGTVQHIAPHSKGYVSLLVLIRTDKDEDFIYGIEGLEKVKEKAPMKRPKLDFSRPLCTTTYGVNTPAEVVGNVGGSHPHVLAIRYERGDPDVVVVNEYGFMRDTKEPNTPYIKNVSEKHSASKITASIGSAKVTLEEGVWAENDEPKPC